jgi:hypothetical protein
MKNSCSNVSYVYRPTWVNTLSGYTESITVNNIYSFFCQTCHCCANIIHLKVHLLQITIHCCKVNHTKNMALHTARNQFFLVSLNIHHFDKDFKYMFQTLMRSILLAMCKRYTGRTPSEKLSNISFEHNQNQIRQTCTPHSLDLISVKHIQYFKGRNERGSGERHATIPSFYALLAKNKYFK